jgi:hypothetical protein
MQNQNDLMRDAQSEALLALLSEEERIRKNRVPGVRTVLVVLSARGMVFDRESLRQKIVLTYPDAAVFFMTPGGKPNGTEAPGKLDLVIDFTGPGQRQQGFFFPRTLRGRARVIVGRNSGLLRRQSYDRLFDEKANLSKLPTDILVREREVQKQVLALAGVAFAQRGDLPQDLGKSIALQLPPISRL